MGWLRETKCDRCNRIRRACICANVRRRHVSENKRLPVRDTGAHPCPKCGRTVRAGICPGLDC